MSESKKTYKQPETEIEILNAQLKISRWAAKKIMELQEKLDEIERKRNLPKPRQVG